MFWQRAVFSDIDYTIVFDNVLDPLVGRAIAEIRERAPFILVTARSLAECEGLPPIPNDGLITENGAAIYTRTMDGHVLDMEWDAVMAPGQEAILAFREALVGQGWRVHEKLHAFSACVERSGKTDEDLETVREALPEGLRLEFSRNTAGRYIEVFPAEAGKDRALRRVCRELDVPLDSTFGLGDNTNDLSMLSAVAIPLCPGNAHRDVKRLVRKRRGYVSPRGRHEGALDVLDEVLRRLGGGELV